MRKNTRRFEAMRQPARVDLYVSGTAAVRSCHVVFPALDGFEQVGGVWRFSFRDYTLLAMAGDLSRHPTYPATS